MPGYSDYSSSFLDVVVLEYLFIYYYTLYYKKMKKLTDKEWVDLVKKTVVLYSKGLRLGQSYMNALHDLRPDLYKEITETENDCFYDDDKIINFINFLTND